MVEIRRPVPLRRGRRPRRSRHLPLEPRRWLDAEEQVRIKTTEAWETDTAIVNQLWANGAAHPADEEWPVSDYYDVGAGETVFQSDGWWKAILKIVEKGTYETEEIMVYLWQERDGDWRRRQKYTIKDRVSWREEATAVESVLDADVSVAVTDPDSSTAADTTGTTASTADTGNTTAATNKNDVPEFDQLNRELDAHLSATASE